MLTYKIRPAITVAVLAMLAMAGAHAGTASGQQAGEHRAVSTRAEEAFVNGRVAFLRRDFAKAMPALTYAAENGYMLADFYRARIFADSTSPMYNQGKAYYLYRDLAKVLIDIDAEVDPRVLFAGQTLTSLARYLRDGIPSIDLEPDARVAVDYLSYAASFFRNQDAEFEIARMRLTGEGIEASPSLAMHSLWRLVQSGHAGAMATFADILWRGSKTFWEGEPVIGRDQVAAFMYARLAADNAPYSERLWIEDIYQRIYCGSSDQVRSRGGARVAGWRQVNGRAPVQNESADPMRQLLPSPVRTCSDGAPVIFGATERPVMSAPSSLLTNTIPAVHGDASGLPK